MLLRSFYLGFFFFYKEEVIHAALSHCYKILTRGRYLSAEARDPLRVQIIDLERDSRSMVQIRRIR